MKLLFKRSLGDINAMTFSRKKTHMALVTITIIILALLSTYPAFSGHFFAINSDGQVHLARLESLYQALRSGRFPSLINFIGFDNHGIAVNAMYPWPTLLIFVIPRLLFQSPMLGLAVGFLLMNIFTLTNAYWLAKSLSKNRLVLWLGVLAYQFNSYHFELMFTRVAIGEAFGYAFLPLVIFGLFKIWKNDQLGIVWLAIGMGLVGNSHILSLLLFTILIAVLELIRIIRRKFTRREFKQLLLSAVISILMASYSLYNVITWGLNHKLVTPTPILLGMNPSYGLTNLLNNDITESSTGAHMGLAVTLLLIYLVAQLFSRPTGQWRYWTIGALSLWILAQDWINWPHFATTPVSLLQFTMRILTIVSLLIMIGLILFLNQVNWNSTATTIFAGLVIIFIGVSGVTQIHERAAQDFHWAQHHTQPTTLVKRRLIRHLTGRNYLSNVNHMTMPDYHIQKDTVRTNPSFHPQTNQNFQLALQQNWRKVAFDWKGARQFKHFRATDQTVNFNITLKRQQSVKLPVVGYHHVNYQVIVNGKNTTFWHSGGQLKTKLTAGSNKVEVSISNESRHLGLFILSCFAYLISLGYVFFYRSRSRKDAQATRSGY